MVTESQKKISILIGDLTSLESYISDLFTFLPVPICFVSPLGVILEFNPAFEKISKYKAHEIIGQNIETIFQKQKIKSLVSQTLEQGEVEAKTIDLLTKSKKKIPVSVFTRARKDEQKQIVGLFISVFNLVEIRKTEQELQVKIKELEKFHRLAVGRELRMVELKQEIKKLKKITNGKNN